MRTIFLTGPTCNGIEMNPGDICHITEENHYGMVTSVHDNTYDQQMKSQQETHTILIIFVIAVIILVIMAAAQTKKERKKGSRGVPLYSHKRGERPPYTPPDDTIYL